MLDLSQDNEGEAMNQLDQQVQDRAKANLAAMLRQGAADRDRFRF